jgi:phosphatidylglycerol:prolipoprotein diacylglycerol transferase
MRSVLFEIPLPWGLDPFPVHGYGLMIVLGFFLGIWVVQREFRRRGLADIAYDLGLVMLLAGLLGGRINYYVQFYGESYAGKSFLEFFKIWEGGLVFYGGAVVGLLGGVLYLRWKRLPVAVYLDTMALGVPLAMAMGRLGCFLHGCCFGKRCDASFGLGVIFPPGSPVHSIQLQEGLIAPGTPALPVHAVQLYQAAHDFLVFFLLLYYLRRPEAPRGSGMPLLFVLYAVGRFILEGMRGDNDPTFTGLTYSQNVSVALFIVFFVLFVFSFRSAAASARRASHEGSPRALPGLKSGLKSP